MAMMTAEMRLTEEQHEELQRIRAAAIIRHEKRRKQARREGRMSFPTLPYECSWAYEEEFRRLVRS